MYVKLAVHTNSSWQTRPTNMQFIDAILSPCNRWDGGWYQIKVVGGGIWEGDYRRECWRRHVWRRAIAHVKDLEEVGEWARNQQKYETEETVATDWHEHLHTCHLHQQSQTWRNRLKSGAVGSL